MDTSNFVAVAALLISAASALYAYRQGRRTLKVTTYHGATDLTLQLDQVFIEHPELRPFFYEGQPPLDSGSGDDNLRYRVLAAAEYALDIFECIWDHRDTYDEADKESWRTWISDMLGASPVCSDLFLENRDWYPALKALVAEERGAPRRATSI